MNNEHSQSLPDIAKRTTQMCLGMRLSDCVDMITDCRRVLSGGDFTETHKKIEDVRNELFAINNKLVESGEVG